MGKAIKSVGNLAGAAAGSIFGNQISGMVGGTKPAPGLRRIGTGRSTFERSGSNNNALDISLDPSIRAGQESFLSNISGLRSEVDPIFGAAQEEMAGIRGELGGLKDFFAEDGDFTDISLNPIRESIAGRRGDLDRTLSRTDVRGSFANQSRDAFETRAGRELTDATASAESARIQNLSTLLGLDANLLQQSLGNETGRINLLASLEESLRGVSTERFNQELSLMGLGQGIGVTPLQQAQQMNQQGIFSGEATKAIGGILGGFVGGPAGAAVGTVASGMGTGGTFNQTNTNRGFVGGF